MIKYFINSNGDYIGSFDGLEPPDGSIEVSFQPEHGSQKWNFEKDGWDELVIPVVDQIRSLEAQQTPRRLREASLGVQESIDFLQDIEDQIEVLRGQL